MEQKLLDAVELQPSGHLSSVPTRFYSGAKDPWFKLSNLYQCDVTVDGRTFSSAEHAYQALQKIPADQLAPWLKGGLYSNWEHVYEVLGKPYDPERGNKFQKKNQVGILAIMVMRNREKFGIVNLKERNDALSVSYEDRWKPIFAGKYANPELRQIFLQTSGELIEFKRGGHKDMLKAYNAAIAAGETPASANAIAQRAVVWGAFNYGVQIKRGKDIIDIPGPLQRTIWGQNVTGKNLTRFRDELKALKRSYEESEGGASKKSRATYKQYVLNFGATYIEEKCLK
tara:strand:+ start:1924 stop:2778 length:855 start_codon:yes stop_codon:yes gene_type:complete